MGFPFDGLRSISALASLIGQDIVARSISLTQAASSVAVQLVNGARLKLGTGTTDYLTSDGSTTITAAGTLAAAAFKLEAMASSSTVPTISSGFGASASIPAHNGTLSFIVNVGTGGPSSGVIGLPAAANGWNVICSNASTFSTTVFVTRQTASTTTTATIGCFDNAGAVHAWTDSDLIRCIAVAY